ncbi:MAG: NfeD family protein [Pseudomonadota bacterium]
MQSLSDLLVSLGPWNWFIVAVALFILETVIPGVHFLWFGLAAVIVGILALALGIAWPWQLIAFAIIAVATVFWVRRYARPDAAKSDTPDLNVRGQQYLGRVVSVEQAIVSGRGKVRVGDTLWHAEGEDAVVGTKVKVIGVSGTALVVERLE